MAIEGREIHPDNGHNQQDKGEAAKLFNQLPGDSVPWDSQAQFNDIAGGKDFTGSLSDCITEYMQQPERNRRGALITTDELVTLPDQPIPTSTLSGASLEWLASEMRKGG
jgi:hypothetical protein